MLDGVSSPRSGCSAVKRKLYERGVFLPLLLVVAGGLSR